MRLVSLSFFESDLIISHPTLAGSKTRTTTVSVVELSCGHKRGIRLATPHAERAHPPNAQAFGGKKRLVEHIPDTIYRAFLLTALLSSFLFYVIVFLHSGFFLQWPLL